MADSVGIAISVGPSLGIVHAPASFALEWLERPKTVVFLNKLGRPLTYRQFSLNAAEQISDAMKAGAANALVRTAAIEGYDTHVYAIAGAHTGIVGSAQAQRSGRSWRAELRADRDSFVTHFALGTHEGLEIGGAFDVPIPIWAGNRLILGIARYQDPSLPAAPERRMITG